jgi:glycosyltransferase involved in cell wall biosynthesis
MTDTAKPCLLVVSQVLPFPRRAGQNLRVYYTLLAAKEFFHITFLTIEPVWSNAAEIKKELQGLADETIVMPSIYNGTKAWKYLFKKAGDVYKLFTGLKFSNFQNGLFDFAPKKIAKAIGNRQFDAVLYEYWHAYRSAELFKAQGIPVMLDTHNVLWQTYLKQFDPKLPAWYRDMQIAMYKKRELEAWTYFDAILAINKEELAYIKTEVPDRVKLFYMSMGIDLGKWPYVFDPATPPRLGYYGSYASKHNEDSALYCAQQVMPLIWKHRPDTELYIIGNSPRQVLLDLQQDKRIKVTGFVEDVKETIRHLSAVFCPWEGTYGFRSRLIEIMAVGVPIIVSPDAVYGMEMDLGEGLYFADNEQEFADHALELLNDPHTLQDQSRRARTEAETKFSYENTYVKGVKEIAEWVKSRR